MVQIVVLTHGSLASELLATARTISGELPNLRALSLDWDEPREALQRRLETLVAEVDEGDGVLILTDLFGDTPSNLAERLAVPGRVEVVTGVNLPMVLRLGCLGKRCMTVGELADWIQLKGRQGIRRGGGGGIPREGYR